MVSDCKASCPNALAGVGRVVGKSRWSEVLDLKDEADWLVSSMSSDPNRVDVGGTEVITGCMLFDAKLSDTGAASSVPGLANSGLRCCMVGVGMSAGVGTCVEKGM